MTARSINNIIDLINFYNTITWMFRFYINIFLSKPRELQ